MTYTSIDHPDHFTFMDTTWELLRREGNDLTFRLRDLCVSKDEPNNPEFCDLQTEEAIVTFRNFELLHAESPECMLTETDGSTSVIPARVFGGEEAMERLANESLFVPNFDPVGEHWVLQAIAGDFFEVQLRFDSVLIEWDGFTRGAWYELTKYHLRDAVLSTPEGEKTVKLTIRTFHEDPLDTVHNPVEAPHAIVGVSYNGRDNFARGEDDYLWLDAIAALQNQLPIGVTIKGCVTCRHGNLCPTGNNPDEVFCTKDVSIAQKRDLFFYTEDPAERTKRSREFFYSCENWQPQSEEFYTYNDFYDLLNK